MKETVKEAMNEGGFTMEERLLKAKAGMPAMLLTILVYLVFVGITILVLLLWRALCGWV